MSNNNDVKRTVLAPSNAGRLKVGDLLSVELGTEEDVQWIWCHHGELGSSVIGYTIVSVERIDVPETRPIGFFPLEEKTAAVDKTPHDQEIKVPFRLGR